MHKLLLLFLILMAVVLLQSVNAGDTALDVENTDDEAAAESTSADISSGEEISEDSVETEMDGGTEANMSNEEQDAMPVFDMTGDDPADAGIARVDQTNAPPAKSADEPHEARVVPEETEPQRARPREKKFAFGLGLSVCGEHGCGAVVRFRLERVSIDLAYGVVPVILSYTKGGDDNKPHFDFDMALVHADGGVTVFFGEREKGFQDGIRVQGFFNNVMGPGGGLGWARERQCSRFRNKCYNHFVLGVGAGVKIFPKYETWVKDHFNLASSAKTSPMSIVQMYLGVTLLWDL